MLSIASRSVARQATRRAPVMASALQTRCFAKFYTKTHEWMEVTDDSSNKLRMGITDFAQTEFGDIVFVDAPDEGEEFSANDSVTTVESVKAVGALDAPFDLTVTKVNEALADDPAIVNKGAESDGWIVEVQISDADKGKLGEMLNKAAYDEFLASQKA